MGHVQTICGTDREGNEEWPFHQTLMDYRGNFYGIARVGVQNIDTFNLPAIEPNRGSLLMKQ